MLTLDTFISDELLFANPHTLVANKIPSLASFEGITSPQAVWEIQKHDRISGLHKRILPLDFTKVWEYWWCIPGRILLPEDMEVLRSDRSRIETILGQLVWLLGGHCLGVNSYFDGRNQPLYDWQEVLQFVDKSGLSADVIDIDFFPTTLQTNNKPIVGIPSEEFSHYVAIEPAHLHLEFFKLQAIDGGFKLQEPKPLCSCQIWTGKPLLKSMKTGESFTRYDLCISTPYDTIGIPPAICL
ncbi:hypothetical protein [Floridanema evergladense]|uniref:Uncharacterized protein n=1 Tax=Floridaenema evergladense BLCC-F167 TaxID=3153639 RepID=A0ABV4WGH9_9CYAN